MAYDPDAEFKKYVFALGFFHHAYTDTEQFLTCLIRNVVAAGRDHPRDYQIAVCMLGGMRMSGLKDSIKRLVRILQLPKETKEAVDKALSHLGDIQFLRDRLAHHFTRLYGPEKPSVLVNDDYASIRELAKTRPLEFPVSALVAATNDLYQIKQVLDPLFSDFVPLPEGEIKLTFKFELPTWQYKPSALVPHRPKSGDSPQWWSPPPQASDA